MIARLHLPLRSPEEIKQHLGNANHYKEDRSAYCLVNSWSAAADKLPELVALTLATIPALADAALVEGFLERKVELADGRTPSQTDLLALLSIAGKLFVMSVEGKVDEPFGNLVADELARASPTKRARIERLAAMLAIPAEALPGVRYQLIHRTAAAVREAKRFCADTAVMMVHSFDRGDAGVEDYRRFATCLGIDGAAATLTSGPVMVDGIRLYLGWTADSPSNEGFAIIDRRKSDAGFFDDG